MSELPTRPRSARSNTFERDKSLEYSSVQKALDILVSFIPDNKAARNLEMSESLGMNKSTVSRLTHVLAHYGFLQQDQETQKFSLGRMAAHLGRAIEMSQSECLAQLARPYVENLRGTVGESVCMEVLDTTGQARVLCGAVGPPPLSVTFPESIPIHVSAGAKVILAFSESEFTDTMIHRAFAGIAENAAAESEVFKGQLEQITQKGVAYDHGEANASVHTVSVPVFNQLKKPVAALLICVPAYRVEKITDPNNVKLLEETATLISSRMFYESPKSQETNPY